MQNERVSLTGGQIFIMVLVFFCLAIIPGIIVDYLLYEHWTKPTRVVVQNSNDKDN